MTLNNKLAGPDIEQIQHENTAEAKRTLLVDTSGVAFSDDNKLPVELTASDIQIGAVEIKDSGTDARALVDTTGALKVNDAIANSLVPAVYDYITMSYSGSDMSQAVFKDGGSGGSTVSTLDMVYDTAGNMTSVAQS